MGYSSGNSGSGWGEGPMYQQLTAWVENEVRLEATLWIKNLVPGGARGVALKSKFPFMAEWTERIGFVRDERRRLRVRTA